MDRLAGWENRLVTYYERVRNAPFQWGKLDCALFACDAIETMTGIDPARDLRGKYETEEQATDYGDLGTLAADAMQREGVVTINPKLAKRGDPILADIHGRQTLGVCDGRRVLFVKPTGGMGSLSIDSLMLVRAWSIP